MRVGQILSLALIMLTSWSCDDEPAQIGEEIFGGNLIDTKIYVSSGDALKATNVHSEAVDFTSDAADFSSVNYLMLGEYNDPIYGSIKADFLSELSVGFPKPNVHHDTIEYVGTELRLQYQVNSWIGDTIAEHKISVYELNSVLNTELNYKSDFDPTGTYYLEPIGTDTFEVKNGTIDTMWQVSGYQHTLAIKINDEVGQRLFDADSVTINNIESFKSLLNGLYVTTELLPNNEPGSLLRLPYTVASNLSQELAVIYRKKKILKDIANKDSIAYDTTSMQFPINKEATKIIRYKHSDENSIINFADDNADKLYLQGMGGTKGKVNITEDFINEWQAILDTDNNAPINSIASVEISFYVDTLKGDFRNTLPSALNLYVLNSDGKYVTVSSQTATNPSDFNGGTAKLTNDGAIKYTFTMQNSFFEEFINPSNLGNSQKNYRELFVGISDPKFNFNRVILHGMNIAKDNPNKSIKPSNITVKYVTVE